MKRKDLGGASAVPTSSGGHSCGCGGSGCSPAPALDRRGFVQSIGAAAGLAAWQSGLGAIAGPFDAKDGVDHFIPVDKKLAQEWVEALFARGDRTWYEGDDLATIGMPVGGVCAGQVYLTGDGRLVYWDVFNSNHNTGFGSVNYTVGRKPTQTVANGQLVPAIDVGQGAAIRVKSGGKTSVRTLDQQGFKKIRFCGEYPAADITLADEDSPVEVTLRAFSPFIPLNADDSTLPATILRYTLKNTGSAAASVELAGWLRNAVLRGADDESAGKAVRKNRIVRSKGCTALVCSAEVAEQPSQSVKKPTVFADFEGGKYAPWTVEGDAFGKAPATGAFPGQQAVSGFEGEGLVNTYLDNDDMLGKLTSPEFTIERPWIGFLVGGGEHPKKTCVNLVVDGKVVRTATGRNAERLEPHSWKVDDLRGKQAKIEIVDAQRGPWGHINCDQIEFRDEPMSDAIPLKRRPDFGTMAVAVLGAEGAFASVSLPGDNAEQFFDAGRQSPADDAADKPLDQELRGCVGQAVELPGGGEATITLVVAWHMPNNYFEGRPVGNYYAKRFQSAAEVVQYVAENFERLQGDTESWLETYYDSTLPRWLLDRIGATVCNLATSTCQWWRNGRFWAWEGVGCCHGTCGHVWNYEHAMARLFPELERSVRTMQDFAPGIGFDAKTGSIGFRGEGWSLWAGDAQGGYILKAYREHQCCPDDEFLKTNWPNIRKALEFLIDQDGNADGLIEGRQHQTFDQDYYGANTFVGSLYLGALRAGEEMARELGDDAFAERCRTIFEAGRENSVKRLFNGEYYIQEVDLEKHPDWQYADGCLADQMFGQGWAHQVALGYLYPKETVLNTLESVWKYCWAPDIAPQNKQHHPERWFAYPGEAGLFTCAWPKSKHLGPKSTRYRDEIWTGIEYQVANHMAWEGMLTECLAICRGAHDRYHPSKHNPFNEIECGDHYARALASWGMLTGLAGFEYHGPHGRIGFAPRITPEDFKCVFTAAEGWGSYSQKCDSRALTAEVSVQWGRLAVQSVSLRLPAGAELASASVKAAGAEVGAAAKQADDTVLIELDTSAVVRKGETLVLEVTLK